MPCDIKANRFKVIEFENRGKSIRFNASAMLDVRQVREHFPTFASADLRTNELEVQALNLDTRPRSRLASLSAHHWADMEAAVTLINGSASLMDCARCYVRTWKGAVKPILLTTAADVLADGRNG